MACPCAWQSGISLLLLHPLTTITRRLQGTAPGDGNGGMRVMLHVEVYQGRSGLETIAEDWRHLQGILTHRRFFHNLGWWKSCLNVLDGDTAQVSFFVVRRARQALAIFPLKRQVGKWCGLPVRQWVLPGHPHMPLNDILCERNADFKEVVATLTRVLQGREYGGWDALSFTEVLAESPLTGHVLNAGGLAGMRQWKSCDSLRCTSSYKEITAKFSRNFRSNLSKARHKLAREKDVEFRSATDQPALNSGFAEFLDIEASGWRGTKGAGTAIKLFPELVMFYQSLIDELCPSREVIINSLVVGGKTIASQFCVKDDDTLYVLKLAYDEEWSHLSPGNMLLERVIRNGIREKLFLHISLVGDPAWFKDWRPEGMAVYSIRYFNVTPAGMAMYGMMKVKQWLRPYYYRLMKRDRGAEKPPDAGVSAPYQGKSLRGC
jgi:CelD/BcsL family acetyltransferase involved in cellulose biosynthesis